MLIRYIFLLLLFLNACDQVGCIEPITNADLAGSTKTQKFVKTVRADGNYNKTQICQHNPTTNPDGSYNESNYCGQWLNTGIYVNKDDPVKLETTGTIYYCMDPWAFSSVNSNNSNSSTLTVEPKVRYNINSRATNSDSSPFNWNYKYTTNTGVASQTQYVNKGDYVIVSIYPPNTSNNAAHDYTSSKWSTWDGSGGSSMPAPASESQLCASESSGLPCWYSNGQYLRANILNDFSKPITSSLSNAISLDATNSANTLSIDTLTGNKQVSFNANNSGTLGFGIYDVGASLNNYKDNMGGYAIDVRAYKCPVSNGLNNSASNGNLLAVVSDGQPIDVTNKLANVNGNNKSPASGNIWLKIDDGFYGDNIGNYNVSIETVSSVGGGYSNAVGAIINLVEKNMIGAAVELVKNIPKVSTYVRILQIMLVLYIVFYAIGFTLGLTEISQEDLVIRIIKMAIVFAFMNPDSWQFFYDNFYRLFGVVDEALDQEEGFKGKGSVYFLIDVMTGGNGTNGNPFTFVDAGMRVMLLDPNAIWRIFTLIFTSPVGIFYFLGVIYAVGIFFKVVLQITISFIMSFIYVAIMVILAPIFIPCFLFSMTKSLFDAWLQYMGRYLLEPIFLIVGLKIIMDMMIIAVANIFNDTICWKCIFWFKLSPFFSMLTQNLGMHFTLPDAIDNLFCLEFFQPWGYDNFGSGISSIWFLLKKFPYVIFLLAIIKALDGYREFIDRLLGQITGVAQQVIADKRGRGDLTDKVTGSIANNAKKPFGLDEKSRNRREFDRNVRESIRTGTNDSFNKSQAKQANKEAKRQKKEAEKASRGGANPINREEDKANKDDNLQTEERSDSSIAVRQTPPSSPGPDSPQINSSPKTAEGNK